MKNNTIKLKGLLIIVSIAAICSSAAGFVISINYIIANRYIHYKMFRLIAPVFQKYLNINFLFFFTVLLILYIIWFLFVEKMKYDKNKVRQFIAVACVTLAEILFISWMLSKFTKQALIPSIMHFGSIMKDLLTEMKDFLIGRANLDNFVYYLNKYLYVIIFLCGIIFITPFWYWLFGKLKWDKVLVIKKVGYIKKTALILVISLLILNLGVIVDGKVNVPKGPNVIILLIDALRKGHVGTYGYHCETTPNIDRFSQDAVVFQNTISQCSWTAPSVASLFSSLYPTTHGLIGVESRLGKVMKANFLNYKIITFAEVLKNKGYATGAFSPKSWTSKELRFDQGFDVFDPINRWKYKTLASELNQKALRWINKNKNRPFFAYLHYMDVHSPYSPPKPYDSFFKSTEVRQISKSEIKTVPATPAVTDNNLYSYIDQYDGEIRYTDYHVGQFLKKLEEYNLFDNTIIVITADHGEAFLEHGFGGHGWTLYNEEIDIPLIVKFPESVKFPDIKQYRIELMDITTTILNVLNCSFPYSTDGWDLLDISDDKILGRRRVFSEEPSKDFKNPPKIAMIKDNFKAIYMVNRQKVTELYDLSKDKLEKNNIINIYPDKTKEFEEEIKSWQKERLRKRERLGLEESLVTITDQRKIEQLKALGYLQ